MHSMSSRIYTRASSFCSVGRGLGNTGTLGAYLLFRRKYGPYFFSTNGIGIITSAMHPRRVDAHRGFSFSYICVANSGKPAPKRERTTVEADIALAARSFRGAVLTRDRKPGALADAHRQGGKVVFLTGFEESVLTLREFVEAAL